MLSPSEHDWADVDYFFAQVAVEERLVDFKPTCGNILAGVGPAAIEMGLIEASGPETQVRIRAVNTGALIEATVQRLFEQRYLDEAAVADVIVREAERRHLGSRRVAQTMTRRGVPGEVAGEAVRESGEGDLERARALLSRRYPTGLERDPRALEKAVRLLVRRGFPYGIARQAIGLDVDLDV